MISKNYTVLKQVGDGATSVVVKACRNKDINDAVAIKKVKRVFEHTALAHRAMRELRLLRCLGHHENVSTPPLSHSLTFVFRSSTSTI